MKFDFGKNKYQKDNSLHQPWLVQRCKSGKFEPNLRSSDYLKLDYMGAAEFECGALPEWQREMYAKLNRLEIGCISHNDQTFYYLCERKHIEQYGEILRDLIDGKIHTKNGARLSQKETLYVGKKQIPMYDQPHAPYSFDCWWDITNGLVFARTAEILTNLKITIPNSIRYMDQQKRKS